MRADAGGCGRADAGCRVLAAMMILRAWTIIEGMDDLACMGSVLCVVCCVLCVVCCVLCVVCCVSCVVCRVSCLECRAACFELGGVRLCVCVCLYVVVRLRRSVCAYCVLRVTPNLPPRAATHLSFHRAHRFQWTYIGMLIAFSARSSCAHPPNIVSMGKRKAIL